MVSERFLDALMYADTHSLGLTAKQVQDVVNRGEREGYRPPARALGYNDPTGNMAVANADRDKNRRSK